jgi:hypothetical protein
MVSRRVTPGCVRGNGAYTVPGTVVLAGQSRLTGGAGAQRNGGCAKVGHFGKRGVDVAVVLVARFDGDVQELTAAYDRAHALIMSRGGAVPSGELRHHCAIDSRSLYIIGVWESAERVQQRWGSDAFRDTLVSVGFPPDPTEMTILDLHAIEPSLQ